MLTGTGGAIYWRSKQQSIVAQSSKEGEFVALSFCVREVLWSYKFQKGFEWFMDLLVVSLFDVVIIENNCTCLVDVRSNGL